MPSGDDLQPFESPRLLIESAVVNLAEFDSVCDSFVKECTYTSSETFDVKTGERVVKLRFSRRVPGRARTLGTAILGELRHALDQAVCDASVVLGAKDRSNTYFPFGKDVENFKAELQRRCRKVHPGLCAFIEKLQPHFGGNHMLWAMSRLAARTKHQRILAVGLNSDSMTFSTTGLDMKGPLRVHINKWNETRNEMEFARIGPGGHLHVSFTLALRIVIGEADVVGGKPASAALNEFMRQTVAVVDGIEAETKRLKG